jgi:hypothetical protein
MAVLNQNLNRAFVLFEFTPANEINFLDFYKKTLSKCCIDPLRPPDLSGLGNNHRQGFAGQKQAWAHPKGVELA